MATGYRLPGVRIEELTRAGSANLSSSFRLICVVGEFNPKVRLFAETVTKSNPLLLDTGINNYSLDGNIVSSIFTVTNTVFIVGTLSDGIYVTRNGGESFSHYNTDSSNIPSNIVNSVYYDSGNLYVATPSGLGVSQDLGETFSIYNINTNPALPSNVVNDVIAEGTNVYIGTSAGLVRSFDNLSTVVVTTALGSTQTTTINTISDTSVSLQDKYWHISSTTVDYYVWYNVGGGGTDPSAANVGRSGIEVSIVAGSSPSAVASATAAALNSVNAGTVFSTSVSGSTLSVELVVPGVPLSPSAVGTTGWASHVNSVVGAAAVAEETDIQFADDVGGNYQNKFFYIQNEDNSSSWFVWFNVDGAGVQPSVSGRTPVPVAISSGDLGADIATAVATELDSLTGIGATSAGDTVTVLLDTPGAALPIGNSEPLTEVPGLVVTIVTLGTDAVSQVTSVTSNADLIGLGGKYFFIDTPSLLYYVWYNVENSNVNPSVAGRTGIEVDLTAQDISSAVATKTAAALAAVDSGNSFTAGSASNVITATTVEIGNVLQNAVDFNTTFTFSTTVDGKELGLLSDIVRFIRKQGNNIYVGSPLGIRVSDDNASTWTSSFTTVQGLASNDVQDLSISGSSFYVATNLGLNRSLDSGVTWSNTSISTLVREVAVSSNYVYAATQIGVYVSSNTGADFVLRSTAEGLTINNTYSIKVKGQVVYVGNQSGLDITSNTDTLANSEGVVINRVGTLANMDNYNLNTDYTYSSTGVITWRNTSSNIPVPETTFHVDYEYDRPDDDFGKSYVYDSYDAFTRDWQFPDSTYSGNIYVYVALSVYNLPQISIVPLRVGAQEGDYLGALETISERDIQDLVVLSTNENVQVAAAFHVQERSAPENAFYRMYWTGGPSDYPLGDEQTPNSLIGRRDVLKNRRTVFVNAPRANVRYVNKTGNTSTVQVDGSFIGGLLVAYYNSRPNGNPNVEAMNSVLPGFNLFVSDYDNYYSRGRLTRAGQNSLYLLEPTGSTGIPRIIDDLTTDNTTIERQSPNIIRTGDYINKDVARQMENVFQGRLMIDPATHISEIANFLEIIFRQYRSSRFIVRYADLAARRSTERPDTIEINYAWEGIYSHKYTNGTTYLILPTAAA